MQTRRGVLASLCSLGTVAIAGCGSDTGGNGESPTGGPSTSEAATTVAVGPGGSYSFDPEEVTVGVGDTVIWTFESLGHNVSARPDASGEVSIPDGAEPFASYEGDDHYAENQPGTTYSHTFETPGEYTYVCAPHVGVGMIGTVTVEA